MIQAECGRHDWRGARMVDAWYLMTCQRCGLTVLHNIGGKARQYDGSAARNTARQNDGQGA